MDTSQTEEAIKVFKWVTVPASREDAIYWLTRLFSHYPKMPADKTSVMIADLTAEILKLNISAPAIADVCEKAWHASTDENPWPPQSGQLRQDMLNRQKFWQGCYNTLTQPAIAAPEKPEPKKSPYGHDAWADMPDDTRAILLADALQHHGAIRQMFYDLYKVPEENRI